MSDRTDPPPKSSDAEPPPGRKRWWPALSAPRAIALWVVTTAAATAIGVWATSFTERAQPEIVITDLRTSYAYSDLLQKDAVAPTDASDPFFQELADSVWMRNVEHPKDKISSVVATLRENEETAENLVRDASAFLAVYPDLAILCDGVPNQDSAERFFEKWHTVDDYIYGTLKGEMKRGSFQAPAEKSYEDASQFLLMSLVTLRNGDEVALVHKKGGLYNSVVVVNEDQMDESEAKEIVKALVYFDQSALRKYIDEVKKDAERSREAKRLQDEIGIYIRAYSRWVVTVLITNSGARPVSFSPEATLWIDSKNANGFSDSQAISLGSRDDKGELQPITVNGGDTKVVKLISTDLVITLPDWRKLIQLFDSGSRNSFVVMEPEGDPWLAGRNLPSAVRPFGSLAHAAMMSGAEIDLKFKSGR